MSCLVQLNVNMSLSWKGGQETYNFPANTIVNVPDEVGAYIKNSAYYASKLTFYESTQKKKEEKKEPEAVEANKALENFLSEIKKDNKKALKEELIAVEPEEVTGLSQLFDETLPTKPQKLPRSDKRPKNSKKIS